MSLVKSLLKQASILGKPLSAFSRNKAKANHLLLQACKKENTLLVSRFIWPGVKVGIGTKSLALIFKT